MSECAPLGVGLIGCGEFAFYCWEAFSQLGDVRLVAAADVSDATANRFVDRFGGEAVEDPQAVAARGDVDIVYIATPPSSHYDLTMSAIRAGKHVLCEKPLAMNLSQADEMLAAAARAGVILPVNYVMRYNPVTDAVKAVIESGVLGKVLFARFTNCARDTKLPPEHWFWDRSVSGGIFIEHGVHFFDLYSHWLGGGRVIAAHAELRDPAGQEDRVMCTVRHDSGAIAGHYHGFDQIFAMDRTSHCLVCEMGDIHVEGWIPQKMIVDAAVDDAGAESLSACCPSGELAIVETYSGELSDTSGRGRSRLVTKRVRLEYVPPGDKPTLYEDGASRLLADQIACIRDRSHQRRITESNGRDALALAEAAAKMAKENA